MAEIYTAAQTDSIVGAIGNRINTRTAGAAIKTVLDAEPDTNLLTDAERTKLAGLEGSKYLGTFTNVGNIPTVDAGPGSYADVDAGAGATVQRYIWDADDGAFVAQAASGGSETAASIKTKYESNANTNAYTDAAKAKLDALTYAADTSAAIAALDAALA